MSKPSITSVEHRSTHPSRKVRKYGSSVARRSLMRRLDDDPQDWTRPTTNHLGCARAKLERHSVPGSLSESNPANPAGHLQSQVEGKRVNDEGIRWSCTGSCDRAGRGKLVGVQRRAGAATAPAAVEQLLLAASAAQRDTFTRTIGPQRPQQASSESRHLGRQSGGQHRIQHETATRSVGGHPA